MTIAGIIWITIVLCCFLSNRIQPMLFITLLFMTFQACNVLVIGGQGVGPGVLTAIVFIIYVLMHGRLRIRRICKQKSTFTCALILLAIPIISSTVNGKFSSSALVILQLMSYVGCMFAIQWSIEDLSGTELYSTIRDLIVFHCIFAIIQVLTTMEILPLRPLLNILFFNDHSQNVVFHWHAYNRMMSTFMEPSYFASFIVGAFYFLLGHRSKWKSNCFLILTVFIEIILTQSSTAYGAFIIVGMLFVACSKELSIKQKIEIISIGLIGLVVLYVGFYSVLDKVIFSKSETASYRQRERFNTRAWDAFTSSILLGVGYKQTRGSSIIPSILGQTGILGLLSYALFNMSFLIGRRYDDQNGTELYSSVKFAILSAVATQLIACPDLDLCSYWVWAIIVSTAVKATSEKMDIVGALDE